MFNNEGVSSLVLTPLPLFLRVFRVRVFFLSPGLDLESLEVVMRGDVSLEL